jgi:mRNA-degrading endonuclease toxin of MazEF toxin-antitoxin module
MANPQRGDIYFLEIPQAHTLGSEQHGRRPWLIVSIDRLNARLPIVVAIPLSSKLDKGRGGYGFEF